MNTLKTMLIMLLFAIVSLNASAGKDVLKFNLKCKQHTLLVLGGGEIRTWTCDNTDKWEYKGYESENKKRAYKNDHSTFFYGCLWPHYDGYKEYKKNELEVAGTSEIFLKKNCRSVKVTDTASSTGPSDAFLFKTKSKTICDNVVKCWVP